MKVLNQDMERYVQKRLKSAIVVHRALFFVIEGIGLHVQNGH